MADKKQTFKAAPPSDHTDLADAPDVTYEGGEYPGEIGKLTADEIAKMKGGHVRKVADDEAPKGD